MVGAEESCSILRTVVRGTKKSCTHVPSKGQGWTRVWMPCHGGQPQGLWGLAEKKVQVEERWGMITDSKM